MFSELIQAGTHFQAVEFSKHVRMKDFLIISNFVMNVHT